ncbi:MAG: response regulator [Planctomycetota bacterium]|nr:response regulator [Planctomycetota bacterium]
MKILVADDSRTMRMIIIRTLKQAGFSGHAFVEADDGLQALTCILSEKPGLVLADWNMPLMTGFELLNAVRNDSLDLRFGFITAVSSMNALQKAMNAGADFFIIKPFTSYSFETELGSIL